MNFSYAIITGLAGTFHFAGRASRSEFWYYQLFIFLLGSLLSFAIGFYGVKSGWSIEESLQTATTLAFVDIFLSISVCARRLHDVNLSGWWMLISFTVIGLIPLYYFYCKKGDQSENRFGENPLGSTFSFSISQSPTPLSVPGEISTGSYELKFYDQALEELENGNRHMGAWARAYSESDDDKKAEKLYIKIRAASLLKDANSSALSALKLESSLLMKANSYLIGMIFVFCIWALFLVLATISGTEAAWWGFFLLSWVFAAFYDSLQARRKKLFTKKGS